MGKTCGCNQASQNNIADKNAEDFMNYTITVDDLDRYNRFYRVVCYPLHWLNATQFLAELDKLQN